MGRSKGRDIPPPPPGAGTGLPPRPREEGQPPCHLLLPFPVRGRDGTRGCGRARAHGEPTDLRRCGASAPPCWLLLTAEPGPGPPRSAPKRPLCPANRRAALWSPPAPAPPPLRPRGGSAHAPARRVTSRVPGAAEDCGGCSSGGGGKRKAAAIWAGGGPPPPSLMAGSALWGSVPLRSAPQRGENAGVRPLCPGRLEAAGPGRASPTEVGAWRVGRLGLLGCSVGDLLTPVTGVRSSKSLRISLAVGEK